MNASMHPQYARHSQLAQRSPHTTSRPRGPRKYLILHPPIPGGGPAGLIQITDVAFELAPVGVNGHPNHPAQQAQYAAAQRSAAQVMDTDPASRKTPRPTDRSMPDGVESLIIGDGVKQYQRLRELERRLDAIMMRKKLDMQDSMQHTVKQYRTLRISISNTVENQPWQGQGLDENTFDFNTGEEATYRVKIEGKLLDDDDEDGESSEKDSEAEDDDAPTSKDRNPETTDQDPDAPSKPGSRTKLSHFFKAITVDFDRGKAGITADTPTAIEWKKPIIPLNSATLPEAADFDCLEFERKGDENLNCTINLYRDEEPERFLLSPELADLLDIDADDRASMMMKLWDYVKAMDLQQDDEKRRFSCDERLKAVFNAETLTFPDLRHLILNHTSPLPPLPLPYTIRVDPTFHTTSPPPPTIYHIPVPLPAIPPPYLASTTNPLSPHSTTQTLHSIRALDSSIALTVQALQASKAKHAFMDSMSKDPAGFLKRWMGSQRRDVEVMYGERWGVDEGGMQGREWRRGGGGGVWGTEGVRESVGLMVSKETKGRGGTGG